VQGTEHSPLLRVPYPTLFILANSHLVECPIVFLPGAQLVLKDADDNLDIVRRAVEDTEVCLSPQRNPFTSLRPVR
jgi:hypothetical protein